MKYEELKGLDQFDHILVTGPQRSGTTIASHILAHDLEYKYIDERTVSVRSFTKLFQQLTSDIKSVIQGPCFASECHWIDTPNTAVVFMIRDTQEIRASQKRIDWKEEELELANYFRTKGPISELRYRVWNNFQKHMMKVPFFELDYQSLSSHPLWVEKEERKNFRSRQWETRERQLEKKRIKEENECNET
jgi:hypothetical protein